MTQDIPTLIAGLRVVFNQHQNITQLVRIGKPAVGPLLDALDTEDQVIQGAIVTVLSGIGSDAVPQLIYALSSSSQIVQGNSMNALTSIGLDAVNPLVEALTDNNPQVCANAGAVLRRLGPDIIPVLKEATGGEFGSLQAKLLLIELDANELINYENDLVEALGAANQAVSAGAIQAASGCGEHALPLLRSLMGDPDPYKQQNSTNAMILLSPVSIPTLVEALGDAKSQVVQQNAVRALTAIGQPAEEELKQALQSVNPYIKQNAQAVFDQIKATAC